MLRQKKDTKRLDEHETPKGNEGAVQTREERERMRHNKKPTEESHRRREHLKHWRRDENETRKKTFYVLHIMSLEAGLAGGPVPLVKRRSKEREPRLDSAFPASSRLAVSSDMFVAVVSLSCSGLRGCSSRRVCLTDAGEQQHQARLTLNTGCAFSNSPETPLSRSVPRSEEAEKADVEEVQGGEEPEAEKADGTAPEDTRGLA